MAKIKFNNEQAGALKELWESRMHYRLKCVETIKKHRSKKVESFEISKGDARRLLESIGIEHLAKILP